MHSRATFAVRLWLLAACCCCCVAYQITPIKNYRKGRDEMRDFPLSLGEAPHWDAARQQLYFVDIVEMSVLRFDPAKEQLYSIQIDDTVTPVVPIQGAADRFILGVGLEFKELKWDGVSPAPKNLTTLHRIDEPAKHRFNGGKCDPRGRLFAGTMDESGGAPPSAGLYSMDAKRNVQQWAKGASNSNGLAWSLDNSTLYFVDTPTLQIDAFDYDVASGGLSNRKKIFDFRANGVKKGMPDGMTIDSDGNLWVAMWDGGAVHKINPHTGKLLQTLDFSAFAMLTTSVAFGGKNLDVLYVTSAIWSDEPYAGYLFQVTELGGAKGAFDGVPFVANF